MTTEIQIDTSYIGETPYGILVNGRFDGEVQCVSKEQYKNYQFKNMKYNQEAHDTVKEVDRKYHYFRDYHTDRILYPYPVFFAVICVLLIQMAFYHPLLSGAMSFIAAYLLWDVVLVFPSLDRLKCILTGLPGQVSFTQ